MEAVIAGGGHATPGMRVVVFGSNIDEGVLAALRASVLDYVILLTPLKGLLTRRSKVSTDALAQAIDAADDLAGSPRLELDLSDASAWELLKLDPE